MNIFLKKIKSYFNAASDVAPPPPPKRLRPGMAAQPSYLKTTKTSDAVLPEQDLRTANLDITSLRNSTSTKKTIRDFTQVNAEMSASTASAIRTAITKKYTVIAYSIDGTIDEEGTKLVQSLARKFDFLSDYSQGFSKFKDIRAISESLSLELRVEGSCCFELVLDKARMPAGFKPISTSQIKWKADSAGQLFPVQVPPGGDEINLNLPTVFYTSLDQDLLQPYSASPVEPALHSTLSLETFTNDLRRVMQRAIHPRPVATIIEAEWKKTIPPSIANDPVKLKEHRDATIESLRNSLSGLKAEDVLVISDIIEMSTLNQENSSTSDEYLVLNNIFNGRAAAGNKTLPSIIGQESQSSSNIASSQMMLQLKNTEGSIQEKLNSLYSRAFTLAARLYGNDVIVKFQYEAISTRPRIELEAFEAMRQSRINEQLSMGLISDTEASIELTGSLPPEGYKELSGTFFKSGTSSPENPYSNVDQGALNQELDPDTPKEPKTG